MTSGGPTADGPKVEVVVTSETLIYCDVTAMSMEPPENNETTTVQQVVEPCTLDDLTSDTMLMVWGRKSGDRIIADVVVFSKPVMFKTGQ